LLAADKYGNIHEKISFVTFVIRLPQGTLAWLKPNQQSRIIIEEPNR
jgi:hypothetical protein